MALAPVKCSSELAQTFAADEVFRRTGQPQVLPTWTATRIAWVRRHEPAVFGKVVRYLMVADYLIHRLTGRYVTDHALSPSTLYYDLSARQWWSAMLALGITLPGWHWVAFACLMLHNLFGCVTPSASQPLAVQLEANPIYIGTLF